MIRVSSNPNEWVFELFYSSILDASMINWNRLKCFSKHQLIHQNPRKSYYLFLFEFSEMNKLYT